MLIVFRFTLSVCFHVFNSGFVPLLKARFELGPREWGTLMGSIGTLYGISQLLAGKVVGLARTRGEKGLCRLLCICLAVMASGRVLAMFGPTIYHVAAGLTLVILCLGVINT